MNHSRLKRVLTWGACLLLGAIFFALVSRSPNSQKVPPQMQSQLLQDPRNWEEFVTVTNDATLLKANSSPLSETLAHLATNASGVVSKRDGRWINVEFEDDKKGWVHDSNVSSVSYLREGIFQRWIEENQKVSLGHRDVNWGQDASTVIERLPATSKIQCNAKCDSPIPAERHSVLCSILHDLSNIYDEGPSIGGPPPALGEFLLPVGSTRGPAHSFYRLAPAGGGCAILYQDKYLAQLNIVTAGMSDDIAIKELEKSYGKSTSLGHQDHSRHGGGEHNVYRFNHGPQVTYFLSYGDKTVTFHTHRDLISLVPAESIRIQETKRRTLAGKQSGKRNENTKRRLKDL